jgi:hypothetical protein
MIVHEFVSARSLLITFGFSKYLSTTTRAEI